MENKKAHPKEVGPLIFHPTIAGCKIIKPLCFEDEDDFQSDPVLNNL